LDFGAVNNIDEEAWICRKTSLKVEMVTDEAGAFSEFRCADARKHQEYSYRALEKFSYYFHD
jgi:hypothetical protein